MSERAIVSPKDVIIIAKGKWYLAGRELTKAEVDNFKSEASLIAKTALWKTLINEMKYHSQKRAIIDAEDIEDLRGAQEFFKFAVHLEKFIQNITKN